MVSTRFQFEDMINDVCSTLQFEILAFPKESDLNDSETKHEVFMKNMTLRPQLVFPKLPFASNQIDALDVLPLN
jgi:hypothetical protein